LIDDASRLRDSKPATKVAMRSASKRIGIAGNVGHQKARGYGLNGEHGFSDRQEMCGRLAIQLRVENGCV
jgi:hypothetical protein